MFQDQMAGGDIIGSHTSGNRKVSLAFPVTGEGREHTNQESGPWSQAGARRDLRGRLVLRERARSSLDEVSREEGRDRSIHIPAGRCDGDYAGELR